MASYNLEERLIMEKIKICNNIEEVKEYLMKYKDLYICLYIADKTEEAWDISTSRVYMNESRIRGKGAGEMA